MFHRRSRPMKQPDLFDSDDQPELFAEDMPRVIYRADPVKVRLKMHAVLDQLKRASSMPWDSREQRYHQTVFPQMSRWLPDEEASQLRFEFEAEWQRLQAAA